ncbi:MAG: response regulator [Cypionkella sp.]
MTSETSSSIVKILLAEDDVVNQTIVRALLQDAHNIELTIVADGRAAIEAGMDVKFDLMIVDQHMPFLTGDRVVRHLRASGSLNAFTPTIRFSADSRDVIVDNDNLPIQATVPKPIRGEIFVATVYHMLGTTGA